MGNLHQVIRLGEPAGEHEPGPDPTHLLLFLWLLLCPFKKQWMAHHPILRTFPLHSSASACSSQHPALPHTHHQCSWALSIFFSSAHLPQAPREMKEVRSPYYGTSGPAERLSSSTSHHFRGLWSPIWTVALSNSNSLRATSKQLAQSLGHREVKGHIQGHTAIQSWLGFEPVFVPLRFAGLLTVMKSPCSTLCSISLS